MFTIIAASATDYEPSDDRAELEAITADLNSDAIDADIPKRWMIVPTTTWDALEGDK